MGLLWEGAVEAGEGGLGGGEELGGWVCGECGHEEFEEGGVEEGVEVGVGGWELGWAGVWGRLREGGAGGGSG